MGFARPRCNRLTEREMWLKCILAAIDPGSIPGKLHQFKGLQMPLELCSKCHRMHYGTDKCAATISPASVTKSGAPRKNARYLEPCVCEVCGKAFDAVPNEVKRGKARACSMACAGKLAAPQDVSGSANPNWKGGISVGGKTDRYAAKHPEKHAAHRLMTSAIRRGELVRGPCEVCGDAKTDGHHDDYSKPLSVRWLCRVHHIEAHHGRFGTQAPPVDTAYQGIVNAILAIDGDDIPLTELLAHKLGRPRDTGPSQGKSKRAAQMREYQRKRRANKKAKEAAK